MLGPVPCPEPDRWAALADPASRGELEAHLDRCDDCRELVAALARARGPAHAPGAQIGKYIVQAPLGAGGMGIVLAAFDPPLERTVALKLVRGVSHEPSAIAAARARLVAEAKAMARVAHPNVVSVYEVVEEEDELFIAMERVDGADLASWLAAAPRSRAERLRVVIETARGIAAAHEAGLVHRDIKPANILVGRDGRARISDLGLASAVEPAPLAAGSPASTLVGTAGYLAPEVVAGARGDARSDQYAFAITAWQALFDERPGKPERGRLGRVLRRALAERPADRYPSLTALADQLQRAARPRWPRYLVAGLAVAAIAVTAAWWREHAAAAASSCTADPTLGGTWSGIRRGELAMVLTARDRSPSHRLVGSVLELVDRRARGWSDAVNDVCAARERGTISRAIADRRGACLEDQRDQLAAILDAIGPQTKVTTVLSAIAHVPAATACATPPDVTRTDDRAATAELRQISALRVVGRYAEAERRLEALAKRTPASDLKLLSSIAHRRADLAMRRGDSRGALPVAHEAIAIAERAHDDYSRLRSLIVLVQVLDDLGRSTEVKAVVPLLEAAAASQTLDDGVTAMVENTLGNALHTAGDYAATERHYRAALAASQREYAGTPAPEIAGALANLGNTLHTEAKRDEARDVLNRSVAMYEATVGPDHVDLAIPLTELGSLADEADDLDGAATRYERVIAIRTAALGPSHPYLCEPLSMLGRVEQERGHTERALALYRQSLAIGTQGYGPDHPLVAAVEIHLAELLEARGQHAEAKQLAAKSVSIWEASGASLPEAYDARFLLAQLEWSAGAHARARALAEAARAGYAAYPAPYNQSAAKIARWLASHR